MNINDLMICKKYNNITFLVDYRTELLSVILLLSDQYKNLVGNKMIPLNNKYIYERILLNFSKYKNHRTIKLFNEIISNHKYFNYDAPVTLFLSLDNNLKCSKLNDYLFVEILNNDNKIYEFINSLSDFVKEIKFDDYYKSNKEEYLSFVEELYKKHINNNIIKFLNEFFKDTNKEFFVNAIPFNSMSNYFSYIDNKVYSNIGITQFSTKDNLYKNWEWYDGDMVLVSLHEFCHSYVNILTKKYFNANSLDYFVDDYMCRFGYDDFLTVINENIVRAIVLYYEKHYFKNRFLKDYNKEVNLGFKYVGSILKILEKNINYNTFEELYKSEIFPFINENFI